MFVKEDPLPSALLPMSSAVLRSHFSAMVVKPVLGFVYDRSVQPDPAATTRLLQKLQSVRRRGGIIVSTDVAVKCAFLKYIELMQDLEAAEREGVIEGKENQQLLQDKAATAQTLGVIMSLWHSGVLLLDEVDLLLHPLRSDLHFPVGPKYALQPGALRWELPQHILDALFYTRDSYLSCRGLRKQARAHALLAQIKEALEEGRRARALQSSPHLVLVSKPFYETTLRPLLAKWVQLWLASKGVALGALTTGEDPVARCLLQGFTDPAACQAIQTGLSTEHRQLVQLAHDWLQSYLPHCLAKINRVSFGRLTAEHIAALDPNMPRSRRLTAVPFVGKDAPSRASEFAHPDILIGLTDLTYRIEGLSLADLRRVVTTLQEKLQRELGPPALRPSALLFKQWLQEASVAPPRLRSERSEIFGSPLTLARQLSRQLSSPSASSASRAKATFTFALGDDADRDEDESDLPELAVLKTGDTVQMNGLFRSLARLPSVVEHYVCSHVFATCLDYHRTSLQASGQELGGSMLFGRRLGFSGTPSDLLPVELGSCHYERGSDGRVLSVLTSPEHVRVRQLEEWNVQMLLREVAASEAQALIDTGALVTGLSNMEVAELLLLYGLATMDAVVFFDANSQAQVLVRAGNAVRPLSQCGIALERRFTFYDQIHTTGIDVKQAPSATAVLTLGKGVTFRDYAQGAYRMRGLGAGQTILLYIIPEVRKLVSVESAAVAAACDLQQPASQADDDASLLVDIAVWLLGTSVQMEKLQDLALTHQNVRNVWRKRAFAQLSQTSATLQAANQQQPFTAWTLFGSETGRVASTPAQSRARECIGVYRDEMSQTIQPAPPEAPVPLLDRLTELIALRESHLTDDDIELVYSMTAAAEAVLEEGGSGSEANGEDPQLDTEMVNEQEQEQEQQQQVVVVRQHAFQRGDQQVPWEVGQLRPPLPYSECVALGINHPFWAASHQFAPSGHNVPLDVPSSVLLSRNFYRPEWVRASRHRRVRHVCAVLRWDPRAPGQPPRSRHTAPPALSAEERARVDELFTLLDSDKDGKLTAHEAALALGGQPGPMDLEQLRAAMRDRPARAWRAFEDGPYYVALSLPEAAAVRRALLTRNPLLLEAASGAAGAVASAAAADGAAEPDGGKPESALEQQPELVLHMLADSDALRRDVLASSSAVPQLENREQRSLRLAAAQTIRLLQGRMYFTEEERAALLNSLAGNSPQARQRWFEALVRCRNSDKREWRDTPLASVMRLTDDLSLAQQRALAARMHGELRSRGLSLLDAFTLFDCDASGGLDRAELWTALLYLELPCTVKDVDLLLDAADRGNKGTLDFEDFTMLLLGVSTRIDGAPDDAVAKKGQAASGAPIVRLTLVPLPDDGRQEEQKQPEQVAAQGIPQAPAQAPGPVPVVARAPTVEWACSVCTFINSAGRTICEICASAPAGSTPAAAAEPTPPPAATPSAGEAVKPVPAGEVTQVPARLQAQVQEKASMGGDSLVQPRPAPLRRQASWTCSSCTLRNAEGRSRCDVCDAAAPEPHQGPRSP